MRGVFFSGGVAIVGFVFFFGAAAIGDICNPRPSKPFLLHSRHLNIPSIFNEDIIEESM